MTRSGHSTPACLSESHFTLHFGCKEKRGRTDEATARGRHTYTHSAGSLQAMLALPPSPFSQAARPLQCSVSLSPERERSCSKLRCGGGRRLPPLCLSVRVGRSQVGGPGLGRVRWATNVPATLREPGASGEQRRKRSTRRTRSRGGRTQAVSASVHYVVRQRRLQSCIG